MNILSVHCHGQISFPYSTFIRGDSFRCLSIKLINMFSDGYTTQATQTRGSGQKNWQIQGFKGKACLFVCLFVKLMNTAL